MNEKSWSCLSLCLGRVLLLLVIAVLIQEEHGKRRAAEQDLLVVEDEDLIDAGRAAAGDFLGNCDQLSADARFDVIDGSGQRDAVSSGREAGRAGSRITQREQCAAMDEAMSVEDLLIDDHLHLGISFMDVDDAHVIALQIFRRAVEPLFQLFHRFIFQNHRLTSSVLYLILPLLSIPMNAVVTMFDAICYNETRSGYV